MRKALAGLCLVLSLIIVSCEKKISYGVLQWSPDETIIASGSFITIYEESFINKTYAIKGESAEMEVETWRVLPIRKKKEALELSVQLLDWSSQYAVCTRNALPVRDEAGTKGKRIYKLRENEIVKVIGQSKEQQSIGKMVGYWYKIVTENGTQGFCFDFNLSLFKLDENSEQVFAETEEIKDPQLENIYKRTWRPEYYRDMLLEKQIDLNRFTEGNYLSFNTENQIISIETEDVSLQRKYTEVARIGSNRYLLKGADILIIIPSDYTTVAEFTLDGEEVSLVMVRLDESVSKLMSRERRRRADLYEQILSGGSVFRSQNYGTLSLDMNMGFSWNNKENLVIQQVLPKDVSDYGKVSLSRFLNEEIASRYDGSISFKFSGGSEINFLYEIGSSGIQLIYVPESKIDEMVITDDHFFDPVQIFFYYENGNNGTTDTL